MTVWRDAESVSPGTMLTWPPTGEDLRALLDEVCTDAHGDDEQLGSIAASVEECGLPRPVQLAGRGAVLTAVEAGRTLLASVTLGDLRLRVPLEDIRPAPGSSCAELVAAWRLWCGLEPVPAGWRVERDLALFREYREKRDRFLSIERWEGEAIDAVIDAYLARTGDLEGSLELKLGALEWAEAVSGAMGFSGFFEWFSESAWALAQQLDGEEELIAKFAGRIRALSAATVPMGWGCDETLIEIMDWLQVFEE